MNDRLIETPLSDKDLARVRICYREALQEGNTDRVRLLEALFEFKIFRDIHAEKNPCGYRIKNPDGEYICKLAQEEMKRLGKKMGYDTMCRWLNSPCHDPLNPKTQKQDKQ